MEFPETGVGIIVLQAAFHAYGVDVSVLPHGGGVVGHLPRGRDAAVAELV